MSKTKYKKKGLNKEIVNLTSYEETCQKLKDDPDFQSDFEVYSEDQLNSFIRKNIETFIKIKKGELDMAKTKYKKKNPEVSADQFDASMPQAQWPEGVQVNTESATGYSYGTLEDTPVEGGGMDRDGFEVEDTDFIVYEPPPVHRQKQAEFENDWEV